MSKLTHADLYSLEEYSNLRPQYRAEVLEHKKNRKLFLGDNATLYFEDRKTIQYQIQEMLRIERVFEKEGIQDELDAYNPLIPDGSNWKATFMIEFEDEAERKTHLAKMIGIEDKVWMQVEGHDKVYAIADEDMDRETEEKTSSVHFMRFELSDEAIAALKSGAVLKAGIDHDAYPVEVTVPDNVRDSLTGDLH